MTEQSGPLRADGEGSLLAIRVTPRGGADAFESVRALSDGRAVLVARLRAAPEGGAANRALISLLADSLGCPASSIRLLSGATSRLKIIRVECAYREVKERLLELALLSE